MWELASKEGSEPFSVQAFFQKRYAKKHPKTVNPANTIKTVFIPFHPFLFQVFLGEKRFPHT